jgi:hypothetical protein
MTSYFRDVQIQGWQWLPNFLAIWIALLPLKGVTNLWQQSKAALELWMQIRSTAYALTQLLALRLWESFPLLDIAPWRKRATITAALFGQWLRIQFIGLRVREAYDAKSGQFVMPFPRQDQRLQC